MTHFPGFLKSIAIGAVGAIALAGAPATAQSVETIDPDTVYEGGIDADLAPVSTGSDTPTAETAPTEEYVTYTPEPPANADVSTWNEAEVAETQAPAAAPTNDTTVTTANDPMTRTE